MIRFVRRRVGEKATVWDGEIAAIREGLQLHPLDDVLILSDSQASLLAIKKARRMGRSRTRY